MTLCLTWVASAPAQVADHLKCYKVKDPQPKASYAADLGGLVAEPGCTIKVPAAMACVPATKTNVMPPPPGGGGTGIPNSFFCYKVKCPKAVLPTLAGTDQFGNRTVTPSAAKLLCAPLAGPTTTSTSTTTTTLRFVDNGDGTVTDNQTGLQWEKKTTTVGSGANLADPHDVDNTYQWCVDANADMACDNGGAADGTVYTDFLSRLNTCTSGDGVAVTASFAGHCDWRLPTIAELRTILLAPFPCPSPCIDSTFGPTASGYWSSTTNAGDPGLAWVVLFFNGGVPNGFKYGTFGVRAVRGGP